MKLKELKRTVNVCWSPADYYPLTLAAGSAAQQVDASFSSSSHLELYSLNLEDPGLDLELKSSLQTQHKFQKLVWSGAGIIVGGCDGGLLEFYNADKLLSDASDALIGSSTKHNGHVSALDINPYQKNLLASGASESEIFIWDLNNTAQPMAPGNNKSQPFDHVQGLAWNQQVQHILGSTFATRCVVWDLRKNEPIMKLSDSQSRTKWRSLSWHPSVATQLCIASEDDQGPVIQLWDLRLAASPLVTLEGHQKGVMALSWCKQDPDLLLSAGKDGRVLCWNPNNTKPGGELLAEISSQQQWVYEVSWSPRDPSLLVAASFDQHLALHTLLGGSKPELNQHNQSNIMDSFGGVDTFSQLPAVSRAAQPAPVHFQQLPTAPRWMKRPGAAKFSFGGKLVTFERCPQEQGSQNLVYISQVVSEPEIVERATELDAVLGLTQDPNATDRLAEYCRQKGDAAVDQNERYTWFFLRANFLPNFRSEVLNLLGFKQDEIPSKFKSPSTVGEALQSDIAALSRDAHTLIERKLANVDLNEPTVNNVVIPNGEDSTSLICRALVCGNLEEAVELCLEAKRVADALVIASLGSQELLYRVQRFHLQQTASEPVSLLAGSLLQSRWDQLLLASANSWRHVLAALLTHCESELLPQYCEMLGDKLSKEKDPSLVEASVICYLCAMSPDALLARWAKTKRSDADSLASLTELALLARTAAINRGRQIQAGGKLESVLNEYASRLASQGCLQSALNTLEGVLQTDLRDRLMYALGLLQLRQTRANQQPQQFQSQARARTVSGHSQKRGHVAHNDLNTTYNSAPAYDQAWQQPAHAPQASYHRGSFSQPVPQASSIPAPVPPPQMAQPMPTQSPRPPSVGPQSGGLTSRSKYKVDPSVQSAPLYNQYSFNNAPSQYGGYNSPLPDQYGTSSVPNTFTPINQPNPVLNPLNPGAPVNPVGPVNPVAPLNPVAPNAVNGGYYNPQSVEPAVAAPVQSKPVPPGWNDPPMLSSKSKVKQETPVSQAPITHPLFGVEPPQHVPLAPAPQYTQYPQQTQPPQQYQPQYQAQYQQQYQDQYAAVTPAYQQPQQVETATIPEPVPVQKAPIPEQYRDIQAVFDSLWNDCNSHATNAQMKRKLEDVQKRLELLYDMFREHTLSEAGIVSLQETAGHAGASQWDSAAASAAKLASGDDFARAAAVLPALKTLLQLARHLQLPPTSIGQRY